MIKFSVSLSHEIKFRHIPNKIYGFATRGKKVTKTHTVLEYDKARGGVDLADQIAS